MSYVAIKPVYIDDKYLPEAGRLMGCTCFILQVDVNNGEAPFKGEVAVGGNRVVVHWSPTGICFEDRAYSITKALEKAVRSIVMD